MLGRDYIDMIEDEWLSKVIFTTVRAKANLSKVKTTIQGDFNLSSLSEAVNTDEANADIVKVWQTRAVGRKSTLVFCVDVAHLQALTLCFRRNGIDARYVTGETAKVLRSERLDAFKRGEFPVLLNCGVYTEGTDIPNIDCVLLARPTRSRNLLVQMIGRGMRLNPGKDDCHVIDFVASLKTGVVSSPTLFGLDPSELVEAADPAAMRSKKGERDREAERQRHTAEAIDTAHEPQQLSSRTLVYRDYDSVNDLIEDASSDRFVRAVSPHCWVSVSPDKFVLVNGTSGDYLTLEKTGEKTFEVRLTRKLPSPVRVNATFARPRTLLEAETWEGALRGADTFAAKNFVRAFIATHGRASQWREAAASQVQLDFLNKYRDEDDQLEFGKLTKGKAGDMITKIKFGARGAFRGIKAGKKREQKVVQKQEQLQRLMDKENVRVGPLRDDGMGDV